MKRRYHLYDAAGKYIGGAPIMEQAIEAAKTHAARTGRHVDVVQITVMPTRNRVRRCRYHPDGRVEQLWKVDNNGAKISVTPHKPGDGGIMAMPMKQNIPEGREDWKLVNCPICGAECWESDLARQAKAIEPELRAACTECALREGLGGGK